MNAFDWVGVIFCLTHHCNDKFFLRGAKGKEREFLNSLNWRNSMEQARCAFFFFFKNFGRAVSILCLSFLFVCLYALHA